MKEWVIIMNMSSLENVDRLRYTLSIIIYWMNKKANARKKQISKPTISHHLRALKDAKIAKALKKGKEVFDSLNNDMATKLLESNLIKLPIGE